MKIILTENNYKAIKPQVNEAIYNMKIFGIVSDLMDFWVDNNIFSKAYTNYEDSGNSVTLNVESPINGYERLTVPVQVCGVNYKFVLYIMIDAITGSTPLDICICIDDTSFCTKQAFMNFLKEPAINKDISVSIRNNIRISIKNKSKLIEVLSALLRHI